MAPRVSVVIPNYQGRHLLSDCLAAIDRAGGPETELIVVDNASTDGSVAWLAEHRPDVRVVARSDNRGYAAACNAGIALARGDVVILLNNDVEVQPGWSAALVECLDADPDVLIAGGLTLYHDEPDRINSAGIDVAPSVSGVDGAMGLPRTQTPPERDVAGVSGVSLAARRSWLEATGGMEEAFFMYYEDLELCLRAWIEGGRVRFVPGSVVLHAGGATSGAREATGRHFHTTRNRLLVAAKLLEPSEAARAWVWSLLSDAAAVAMHLARGRFAQAGRVGLAKGRGVVSAMTAVRGLQPARRRVAATRQRSTADLRQLGLIAPASAAVRRFSELRERGGPLR